MTPQRPELDVLIVGAGFSGLHALHAMRVRGLSAQVLEAASGVGGTWYWNRYPGARCDVETTDYQFSFDERIVQGWTWSERYATQPEILAYLNYVSDLLDLRGGIQFDTRVVGAEFDERAARWLVTTDRGERIVAKHCVMATGCLSSARLPDIPGIDRFAGSWFHTGRWPHEGVDFRGRSVAMIGTGSSAIQSIPVIAGQARQLTVFQRTPNFSVPAHNRPRDPDGEARMKLTFAANRELARHTVQGVYGSWVANDKSALEVGEDERVQEFERRWGHGGFGFLEAFTDLWTSREANTAAADFVRAKIRGAVDDPATAELLCPKDHPFGTKRLCVDIDYHATYNRSNVSLVDIRADPIEEITPRGIRTRATEYEFDSIVFATGYDAMTGALLEMGIRGCGGLTLAEKWSAGPLTYLGVQTCGFPNLFMITGPGSPSVLSNMITSIEQHVEWVADCIAYLHENQVDSIEADLDAERAWVAHVNELAHETLLPEANSWYMGANIPGKPRVFMPYTGGVGAYRAKAEQVAAAGYRGFTLGARGA